MESCDYSPDLGDTHHLSELRIVLLGYKYAGKSFAGNTILGREEFPIEWRTAHCVQRRGEVAGRPATVVVTPGWRRSCCPDQTPYLTKEQIELSVSLCPPGPHALLLVIPGAEPFTEKHKHSVQEHMELLGERVWSHTMVLFTHGDWLGDTGKKGGEILQWLVEKCGNRYHVLNNQRRDDHMQVTQLMGKIEEMVAANRGQHYEMDRQRIKELEEKKKRKEENVKERMMKVKTQRETLRSQMGDSYHLSELRIVLLGYTESGKSSSGNTILGRAEFDTAERTALCVKRRVEAAKRNVTVVEAPGWQWTYSLQGMKPTKEEIDLSLCPPALHALLLVIRADIPFTDIERRSLQEHLERLGERVWSHTIVLFTHGDWLGDTPIEQHIESEGESLQWLVEKCGNRYHVLNNQRRDDHMQVTQLMEKIEEMVAANRGQHYEIASRCPPSHSMSLSSSTDSSFTSRTGAEETPALPMKRANSVELVPPRMSAESSGDSDGCSFNSSTCSSLRSQAGFDISSFGGSQRSIASYQSSGYGSLRSVTGSVQSLDPRELKLRSQSKEGLGEPSDAQETSDSKGKWKNEKKKSAANE